MILGRRRLEVKSAAELQMMRRAGLVVAAALAEVAEAVRPGATGRELDRIAEDVIRSHSASPSFLGYLGYPASICVSTGHQVVHGIPDDRPFAPGEIVSIDCGAVLEGWHGDAAVTVPAGEVSAPAAGLVEATRRSLWAGLAAAVPGARLSDLGAAVEASVRSEPVTYGIVRDYVGHGIGREMHLPPDVPNVGPAGRGPRLVPGVVLAIEPMVTSGSAVTDVLADGWTVVTADGSLAAHWEHTVAVTESGPWVLTAADGGREGLGGAVSDLARA